MTEKVKHTKFDPYAFFLSTKTAQTYTNLAISLFLVIVLVFFALIPTLSTVDKIKDKIEIYEDLNAKIAVKIKSAQTLNNQITASSSQSSTGLKEEIEFLNTAFFSETDLVTLYKNIQKRAEDNKIAITTFTPKLQSQASSTSFDKDKLSPSNSFFEINLAVEAKDIVDIESFITSFEGHENFPIFSRVKNISVRNASDETNGNVNANIVLVIYRDNTRKPGI